MEWDRQRQQQPVQTEAMDRLTNSIAGQPPRQQTPPPNEPQQLSTEPPPPAADSTEANRMETGEQDAETSQGDIAMDDSDGVHGMKSMEMTVAKET